MSVLYGLVVCGGESSRMGTDKSALEYYGQPQRHYLYHMLEPFCSNVFLSCNRAQLPHIPQQYHPLPDALKYEQTGPMAALLTAFDLYPHASFLVVGCDYPFLSGSDVNQLVRQRNTAAVATAFYNIAGNLFEPLLAVYEPSAKDILERCHREGRYSLRHLLSEHNATAVYPTRPDVLKSVDDKASYETAVNQLRSAGF